MGYLTDVTDAQWAWIEPMLPPQEGRGRRRTVSLRRVIDALMYHDRTGCQWRYLAPPRDQEWPYARQKATSAYVSISC